MNTNFQNPSLLFLVHLSSVINKSICFCSVLVNLGDFKFPSFLNISLVEHTEIEGHPTLLHTCTLYCTRICLWLEADPCQRVDVVVVVVILFVDILVICKQLLLFVPTFIAVYVLNYSTANSIDNAMYSCTHSYSIKQLRFHHSID